MMDYFVKSDFDDMYEGTYFIVRDKITAFLKRFREQEGFTDLQVSSENKGRSERGLWGTLVEKGYERTEVPHFTLDIDNTQLSFSLGVSGSTISKKLANAILTRNMDSFMDEISQLESKKEPGTGPNFAVSYDWVKYHCRKPTYAFTTNVDLYCNFYHNIDGMPSKGMETPQKELFDKRKEKISDILKELSMGGGHPYFRITLKVPKSFLLEEKSLHEQVRLVHIDAKRLLSFYKDWKELCA